MAVAKKTLDVPPLRIGRMEITLIGTSPLVCNRFSEKAIQQMLDAQMGKPKQGREAKDPADVFLRSLYPIPGTVPVLHDEDMENVWAEGRFGFPAIGLKAAAVRAATDAQLKMTDMRRSFHINEELVEIVSDPPKMRMDMVRVGMGSADIRFRAEFTQWKIPVIIRYNVGVINQSQIINLFRTAGFGVGIGEWRPEKDGMWGMFTVGPNVTDLGEELI